MKIGHDLGNQAPVRASVVAPGNHDGVHLGHRALIETARQRAAGERLRTIALTFDPHPAALLAPGRVPPLLTSIERRRELLRGIGADEVIVQPFDPEFAALSPEDFMQKVLIGSLRARALVVGPDFGFGVKRSGNVDTLRALGQNFGLEVMVVDQVRAGDLVVSSSAIRRAIAAGDVEKAALMLGRVHELCGLVVQGDRRGRELGAPTVNLQCGPELQPADGVYAVVARQTDPASATRLLGVTNIGVRPTFAGGRSVETHLLDFHGDLYGAHLRVGFVRRLRGEKRFADKNELSAQIKRDIEEARRVLDAADPRILSWI